MFLVISDNAIRTFILVCMNVALHLQILSHPITTVLFPSAQKRGGFLSPALLGRTLSESLRQAVERQRRIDEGDKGPLPLIIHLAGFEEREGIQAPAVWVIRNDHSRHPQYLSDIRKEFEKVDCLWSGSAITTFTPGNIRDVLTARANRFDPFWFHQGIDLDTFNVRLDALIGSH